MSTDLSTLKLAAGMMLPGTHECGSREEAENENAGLRTLKEQLDRQTASPLGNWRTSSPKQNSGERRNKESRPQGQGAIPITRYPGPTYLLHMKSLPSPMALASFLISASRVLTVRTLSLVKRLEETPFETQTNSREKPQEV